MSRTLIVIAAFLTLSVPAALAVPPADKGKPEKPGKSQSAPGQSAEKNAAKACKAERGTTAQTMAAFKAKYGTNANKANAFGKCVSGKAKKAKEQKTKEPEAEEQEEASENAAKKCKAERGTTAQTIEAFKQKYGTNKNKANAFGKCVSKLAKAQTSRELRHRIRNGAAAPVAAVGGRDEGGRVTSFVAFQSARSTRRPGLRGDRPRMRPLQGFRGWGSAPADPGLRAS